MKFMPVILEIGGTLDYQIQEPVRGSKDLYIVFFKELNEQFWILMKDSNHF